MTLVNIGAFNLPDTVRVIPIILHLSIRKQLARPDEISQLRHRSLWIIPFGAVKVTPEHEATLWSIIVHQER
jgi:hypothetical protein